MYDVKHLTFEEQNEGPSKRNNEWAWNRQNRQTDKTYNNFIMSKFTDFCCL